MPDGVEALSLVGPNQHWPAEQHQPAEAERIGVDDPTTSARPSAPLPTAVAVTGLRIGPPAAARPCNAATAAITRGPVASEPVTTTSAGAGACGNARVDLADGLHDRLAGRRVHGRLPQPHAERRRGQRDANRRDRAERDAR